jgi:hypothetical protein
MRIGRIGLFVGLGLLVSVGTVQAVHVICDHPVFQCRGDCDCVGSESEIISPCQFKCLKYEGDPENEGDWTRCTNGGNNYCALAREI